MPKYQITLTNESDYNSRGFLPGESRVEFASADSEEIIEEMVIKEVGRTADVTKYSWVIQQLD